MNRDNTITALLETFQECKKRGERATLFLETRNGEEFAIPYTEGKTAKNIRQGFSWTCQEKVAIFCQERHDKAGEVPEGEEIPGNLES